MARRSWQRSRFDDEHADEPLGPLSNLADVMLVFACGLIAALAAASGGMPAMKSVETGRELPDLPAGLSGGGGPGYQAMGQVFRDPETGKLYLVGPSPGAAR